MRFRSLTLERFGCFTDVPFDFGNVGRDFHIVHGPNEAGKSTLLRAITASLFKFDTRSTDNFLHEHRHFRVSVTLENCAGETLTFARLKKNSGSLVEPAAKDKPLDDAALIPFLGAVDKERFCSLFGLDAAQLRAGAEVLFDTEGDLGKALFAATESGRSSTEVLRHLQERADALYRNRGSSRLRETCDAHTAAIKAIKELAVDPAKATQTRERAMDLEKQIAGFDHEIQVLEERKSWLDRCEHALPLVSEKHELERQFARFSALPTLPSDFSRRAQTARDAAVQSEQILRKEAARAAEIAEEPMAAGAAILAHADRIETLAARASSIADRQIQIDEWEVSLSDVRSKLAGLELKLGGTATLPEHPMIGLDDAVSKAEALEKRLIAEQADLRQAERFSDEQRRLVALKRETLGAEPTEPPTECSVALDAVANLRDLLRGCNELRSRLELADSDARARLALLRDITSSPEDAAALPVPRALEVERIGQLFEPLQRARDEAAREVSRLEKERKAKAAKVEKLRRAGIVHTAEDLLTARRMRDGLWDAALAAWKGGAGSDSHETRYPAAVQEADRIADDLIQHAEDAALLADALANVANAEEELAEARLAGETADAHLAAWSAKWEQLWAATAVAVAPPATMREWLDRWERFAEKWGERTRLVLELQARETSQATAHRNLAESLCLDPALTAEVIQQRVAATLKEYDHAKAEWKANVATLEKEQQTLDRLERELPRRKEDVNAICAALREAGRAHGLSETTSELDICARLRLLQNFCALRTQRTEVESKLAAHRMQIDAHHAAVREITTALGMDSDLPDKALQMLVNQLATVREHQRHLSEQASRSRDAERAHREAAKCFGEFLAISNCPDPAAFELFLGQLEERDRLGADLDKVRRRLAADARGVAPTLFEERLLAENPDGIRAELDQLTMKIRTLRAQQQTASVELGSVQPELHNLEREKDAAANQRQIAESLVATAAEDALEHLRLRIAIRLLEEGLDTYRKENAGPVLTAATQFFHQITNGAFESLEGNFDEKGNPVIEAIRRGGGKPVPIHGLSEGTRDQLFLALRLAVMTVHSERHEPMPLILDDILATFDDNRATAVLRLLADLGASHQILLFTHHAHLCELARQHLANGSYRLHALGA